MEDIKELTDKYFVLKIDDVLRFGNDKELEQFNKLTTKIALRRKEEGKGANTYLVLNLDDDIDFDFLLEKMISIQRVQKEVNYEICRKEVNAPDYFTRKFSFMATGRVQDIAIPIVNAILSADKDAQDTSTPK